MPTIALENVTKYYQTGKHGWTEKQVETGVEDVSLTIEQGDFVFVIGSSGAGKSTLLDLISGQMRPDRGVVRLEGRDLSKLMRWNYTRTAMLFGKVPQEQSLIRKMTVEENLEMGAYTQPKSTVAPGLERVYEQFPRLKERRRQVAGTLSGGEQQMLVMGRALMSNPKLLMLDEPSMGLAPILIEQIFQIVEDLHKAGTTVLLVEQNAQMALSIATRGYVLETGKITMTGTGQELLHDDNVRKAYLGG